MITIRCGASSACRIRSALERPREPVLQRPHRARRAHVLSLARAAFLAGQSHDVLLAAIRAGDDRDEDPARPEEAEKRLARRLHEAMNEDPVEALAGKMKVESVRPSHRDIGET